MLKSQECTLTPAARLLNSDIRRQASKELRISTIHRRVHHQLRRNLQSDALVAIEVGGQIPGVQGHAHDAVGPMPAGVLDTMGPVPHLTSPVALVAGRQRVDPPRRDADVLLGEHLGRGRRHPDDAHAARGLGPGRLDQRGREELGEQERAQAVDAHVELVALGRPGELLLGRHDARVVEEHVQLGFGREEAARRRFDGAQVGEVEREEDELPRGLRQELLDVLDGLVRLRLGARCYVDLGVLGVQHARELFAHACVGPRYDVHFRAEIRHVLLREAGLRGEHLR